MSERGVHMGKETEGSQEVRGGVVEVSIVKWQNLLRGGSFLYRRCSIEKVRAQRMGWGGRTRRTGAGWSSILCFLLAILCFFLLFFFFLSLPSLDPMNM